MAGYFSSRRVITLEHLQNVGPCCADVVKGALEGYEKSLGINLGESQFDFTGNNKKAMIVVNPDNLETDEALEALLKIALRDFMPEAKVTPQYHGWQASLGIGAAAVMMIMMMLEVDAWHLHEIFAYAGTLITLLIGRSTFYHAWLGLKYRKLNMDSLFSLSAIAAVAITLMHVLAPYVWEPLVEMPMLIDSGLMILGFRHVGLWLRESLVNKIGKREKFVDRGRKSVFQIWDESKNSYVAYEPESPQDHKKLSRLESKVRLKLLKGQCIPVNGTVLNTAAQTSFVLHTGSDEPVTYPAGAKLCAGMIVESNSLEMEVTDTEAESYLHKRDVQLETAQLSKAPIQNTTDKIASYFTRGVIIAAAAYFAGAYFSLGLVPATKAAMYFLVCACPCALGLVTGLALTVAHQKVVNKGLEFRTEKGVEAAAKVKVAALDINGTLTTNKLKLVEMKLEPMYQRIVCSMESTSKHPIARLITQTLPCVDPSSFDELDNSDRRGIRAVLKGTTYRVGNEDYIQPSKEDKVTNLKGAHHVIYVEVDRTIVGHFLIQDPLKPGAREMVRTLEANGIQSVLLTGVSAKTAACYAEELGIDQKNIYANCSPAEKAQHIERLQKQYQVAMVGDGANDTDAMKKADLAVVVRSPLADPMTKQEADIEVTSQDLHPIIDIFALGRQTVRHIHQNFAISFAYNIFSLVFVACAIALKPGLLTPAFGAALMVVNSSLMLMNAWRIRYEKAVLPIKAPPLAAPYVPQSSPSLSQTRTPNDYSASSLLRFCFPSAPLPVAAVDARHKPL